MSHAIGAATAATCRSARELRETGRLQVHRVDLCEHLGKRPGRPRGACRAELYANDVPAATGTAFAHARPAAQGSGTPLRRASSNSMRCCSSTRRFTCGCSASRIASRRRDDDPLARGPDDGVAGLVRTHAGLAQTHRSAACSLGAPTLHVVQHGPIFEEARDAGVDTAGFACCRTASRRAGDSSSSCHTASRRVRRDADERLGASPAAVTRILDRAALTCWT